jgi:hypothetical protein
MQGTLAIGVVDTMSRESDAIRKLTKPGDIVRELPAHYSVSHILFRDDAPYKWISARTRSERKEDSDEVMFTVAAITQGIELANTTGLPFILVVDWQDVVGSLRVYNTDAFKMVWGPNSKPEPIYVVPSAHFAVNYKKRA